MCSIHANSAADALAKLATLPLLAGRNIDSSFVLPTVASSIDLVVHAELGRAGHRRVVEIAEPTGRVFGGAVEANTLFALSGDVLQAMSTAQQAGNGVKIGFSLPREGTTIAVDTVVIPKNAPHLDSAYAYLNYLLEPKVIADISNAVQYPNGNAAALQYVTPALRENPAVYPPQEVLDSLFPIRTLSPAGMRLNTRLWTRVKSGT